MAFAVVVSACNSTNQQTEKSKENTVADTLVSEVQTAVAFNDKEIDQAFVKYIALKDNLVKTNYELSANSAKLLAEKLATLNIGDEFVKSAEAIANAKDIVAQRDAFTKFNQVFIPKVKASTLNTGTVYFQFCPMANNGDGGDWISLEKKVQNPYYGDEMMECGRVTEEKKSK